MHSFKEKRRGHGCLWWAFIGWWAWIFKFMWETIKACCTMGLSLIFRRKKHGAVGGKTVTASKTFNKTVAVCQNCGHHWKI